MTCLQFRTLTPGLGRTTIPDKMTEHGFLAVMLALVGFEVVALGYITYRIFRILERAERVSSATFLEVRKILSQPR